MGSSESVSPEVTWLQNHIDQLERLENEACIDAYSSKLPTKRSDVVLITSPLHGENDTLLSTLTFDPTIV